MGYYTFHEMTIADKWREDLLPGDSRYEDVEREYKRLCTYNLEEKNEELWDNPFHENCKWYEEEDHSIKVSKMFPNLYIQMNGDGEESGDIWAKLYRNGELLKTWQVAVMNPTIKGMLMPERSEEEKAVEVLEMKGFHANNLWQIADVRSKWPECTDEQAMLVLENAFQNDATYQQIWMSIDYAIDSIKPEVVDLFEHYTQQPPELKKICDKWAEIEAKDGFDYNACAKFLEEIRGVGYTFEYGLDAQPFNLTKI